MKSRGVPPKLACSNVTIRVSGKLFHGHMPYLEQLVKSAGDCRLWPLLNLSNLEELDRTALLFLVEGENREFGIVGCPNFVREWIDHERGFTAAA